MDGGERKEGKTTTKEHHTMFQLTNAITQYMYMYMCMYMNSPLEVSALCLCGSLTCSGENAS